jgi:adenylate cyclase
LVTRLDDIIYDARLAMTAPRAADRRIVILQIDEKSLGEIGRWPWSRDRLAELVERLFDGYGVALAAFDVVWAERDASSGIDVLDRLAAAQLKDVPRFRSAYESLRPSLDFDARFAASLKGRPVVLGYYFNGDESAVRANVIPRPVLPKGSFAGGEAAFYRWRGYTGNLPVVAASAAAAGHINSLADADGVLRRVPLIVEFEGQYYEAFSLAVFRTLLAKTLGAPPPVEPGFKEGALEWLRIGGAFDIPVDRHGAALVPYRGGNARFRYVSLVDVLKGRVAKEALQDKLVLIGATAPALEDLRATPVSSVLPGVEVHASMIAGMLDQQFKQRPWYAPGAEWVVLVAAGVALALLIPLLSALWATLAVAAAAALVVAFNVALWNAGLVLPLASALLMVAALYTLNMAYGYFIESRSKRLIAQRFREYVPPEVVARMERDPAKYDLPRNAELSILFCDVRGFTGISETLEPEALREYINDYLTEMSMVIRGTYRGTLDKYIGDAIMAFWNAPVEDPRHARNAVLAALAMQRECKPLGARFVARGWPALSIGIGVNTGTVRVGDMGSRLRRAYTAIGDAVNVASRLESRTRGYGVGILVADATRRLVEDVVFREIDRVRVKGKAEAVTIYEPIGLESEVGPQRRDEIALWHAALRGYRARDWDAAAAHLARLARLAPDCTLYTLAAGNVEEKRRAVLPADWDGVTVFDEK